jgi:hypothetical protein
MVVTRWCSRDVDPEELLPDAELIAWFQWDFPAHLNERAVR